MTTNDRPETAQMLSECTMPMPPAQTSAVNSGIDRVLHIRVPVRAVIAERPMPLANILGFTVGSIIEFQKRFDSELTLCVGNMPVAEGQAVKIGENFGVRISRIRPVSDRVAAMGG